ncbi:helix-turn-helix domain-containing protein [Staphylococcus saprophyticus]|uniref:helix-turn-helix domain-containing protein n=1 Tax=Staphylococcus saprophyticus TaxID=29385 RepID=UPI003BF667F2
MILKRKIVLKSFEFRVLLLQKELTFTELGKRCGITPNYISMIVSHRRSPAPAVAQKICDNLGVEFEDIFEIKDVTADNEIKQK